MLYNKPLIPLPILIKWGLDHEAAAREPYVKTMHLREHPSVAVKPLSFIIHPQQGWFGSSPDRFFLSTVHYIYWAP